MIEKMKKDTYIVNTARENLIVTIARALKSGQLRRCWRRMVSTTCSE